MPAIHAEAALTKCFRNGALTPEVSMDHRIKSGGDE